MIALAPLTYEDQLTEALDYIDDLRDALAALHY